jgi:hypothetical protein
MVSAERGYQVPHFIRVALLLQGTFPIRPTGVGPGSLPVEDRPEKRLTGKTICSIVSCDTSEREAGLVEAAGNVLSIEYRLIERRKGCGGAEPREHPMYFAPVKL